MRKFFTIFILKLITIVYSYSSEFNTELLPELISPSNAGTNYVLSFVPTYYNGIDDYNQVKFYISSSTSAKVSFKVTSTFYNASIDVPANSVVEHSILAKFVMPYNKTNNSVTPPERVYDKKALVITSDSPIIIYVLLRFRNYTEGFLALPMNFLSGDYNITTFNDYTNNKNSFAPSTAVISAAYDNSRVTFKLGGNSGTQVKLENGDSLFTGNTARRTLNKGDVWVISGYGTNNDLTGSNIQSSKPVSLVTGNFCAQVPTNLTPCEYLIEQEIPLSAYSRRYYVTPVIGRPSGSWVKVSSVDNETEVKLNNETKGTIKLSSGKEDEGFLSFRVNTDNKPAIITSDKRINVVQFNTGTENVQDFGVPFKIQTISSDNFAKRIIFNLSSSSSSYFFNSNYINIVFRLNDKGQIPDDLTLSLVDDGKITKKAVKDIATENPVPFPVTEPNGIRLYCITVKLEEKHGRYILESSTPIGAVVYGVQTTNDGFGYPAMLFMKNYDKSEDLLAPSCSTTSSGNGNYSVSITDEPANSSKIRSNLAMIHLIKDSSYNYLLNSNELVAGVEHQAYIDLRPIDIKENALAYVRIVDAAGNDTVLRFFYSSIPTPPKLTMSQLADTSFCPGSSFFTEYKILDGLFQGENIFRVKLGKRSPDNPIYPIVIAQASGSMINKLNTVIPRNLVAGNDYFIYVESTIPRIFSDTLNINIYELLQLNIQGYNKLCANNTYKFYTGKNSINKKWTTTNANFIGPDTEDTVYVQWTSPGKYILKLDYSGDNCSDKVEFNVDISNDIQNEIEGINQVCRKDEIFYNSKLSDGSFKWSVIGGKIDGEDDVQLIQIIWESAGIGKIKLIYKDPDGYMKEFDYEVNVTDLPPTPTITRDNKVLISSSASGNQWFFNGNIISGGRAKTYDTKDVEGNYTVQVTEGGCKSEFSNVFDYKITSTGKNELNNEIMIFPNPANDIINIKFNFEIYEDFRISIFDSKMSLVNEKLYKNNLENINSISLSCEGLSAGIYYLRIKNGVEVYHKTFLIIK